MMYVEWLRVRRAALVIGIILAAFVLLAIGARLWMLRYPSEQTVIHRIESQPGTTRSETTLSNGTHRTVLENATARVHATIDDLGNDGTLITIDEPRSSDNDIVVTMGSRNVERNDTTEHIVMHVDEPIPIVIYFGAGWFLAMIVATMLGAPFARENDGHLEYALTKPASRTALAAYMVGVDALAIVGAVVATALVLMIATPIFGALHLDTHGALLSIGSSILVPLGWYALLNACTASMRRAYGVILGISWPVLFGINGLVAIPWDQSALGRACWWISHALVAINPITYLTLGRGDVRVDTAPVTETFAHANSSLLILLALFTVYTALAVIAWRRVEA